MAQKSIYIQHQNIGGGTISVIKQVAWTSITFDNIKITIDAYNGLGYSGEPREDCLIELVDKKEVFNLTAEQLLRVIRFYIDYSADKDAIPHCKNKYHYIIPDAIKKA